MHGKIASWTLENLKQINLCDEESWQTSTSELWSGRHISYVHTHHRNWTVQMGSQCLGQWKEQTAAWRQSQRQVHWPARVNLEMLVNLVMSVESRWLQTLCQCRSDLSAGWIWFEVLWLEEQAEKAEVGRFLKGMTLSSEDLKGECGLRSGYHQQTVMACALCLSEDELHPLRESIYLNAEEETFCWQNISPHTKRDVFASFQWNLAAGTALAHGRVVTLVETQWHSGRKWGSAPYFESTCAVPRHKGRVCGYWVCWKERAWK